MSVLFYSSPLVSLWIFGAVLFAASAAFWAVTETLKKGNDQGDSTGDRFYYITDFEITRELDNVSPNFDDSTLSRPYNM